MRSGWLLLVPAAVVVGFAVFGMVHRRERDPIRRDCRAFALRACAHVGAEQRR